MDLNAGHRERLKAKLLNGGGDNLYDYEILELLLFNAIPRRDVRPLAKTLIRQFSSLGNVVNANPAELKKIKGVGPSLITFFKLLKETIRLLNKEQIVNQACLDSPNKVIEYLRANIGYKTTEHIIILYLNHKKRLIATEICDYGSVTAISLYPREVLKSAVHHDASHVIVSHNHPTDYTRPSNADVEITLTLRNVLNAANISLMDHIVISKSSSFSFKMHGII